MKLHEIKTNKNLYSSIYTDRYVYFNSFFQKGYSNSHAHKQCKTVSVYPDHGQQWSLLSVFNFNNNFNLILSCISFIKEIETFSYISFICIGHLHSIICILLNCKLCLFSITFLFLLFFIEAHSTLSTSFYFNMQSCKYFLSLEFYFFTFCHIFSHIKIPNFASQKLSNSFFK